MTEEQARALTKTMSMAEIAVADTAAEGLTPMVSAIGPASQVNLNVRQAMPKPDAERLFKLGLIEG